MSADGDEVLAEMLALGVPLVRSKFSLADTDADSDADNANEHSHVAAKPALTNNFVAATGRAGGRRMSVVASAPRELPALGAMSTLLQRATVPSAPMQPSVSSSSA